MRDDTEVTLERNPKTDGLHRRTGICENTHQICDLLVSLMHGLLYQCDDHLLSVCRGLE